MSKPSNIRQENCSLILRTIRRNNSISKNAIAAATGLSQVTVHKIVKMFQDQDICMEAEDFAVTGGRNAAMFRINGKHGTIIGQAIRRDCLTTTAYDYAMQRIYLNRAPINLKDPEKSLAVMKREFRLAAQDRRLLGCGITIPGRCTKDGVIGDLPGYPKWRGLPMKGVLEEAYGIPVCIDNDTNALAISAGYSEIAADCKDYVYLEISAGVGLGAIVNGQLFRGPNGCACEVGHTTVMLDGPLCSCGSRGCLDAFLNEAHLLAEIDKLSNDNVQTPPKCMEDAIRLALQDISSPSGRVIRDSVQYIAAAIANIVRIYDTPLLFIRCPWINRIPQMFRLLTDTVLNDLPWLNDDSLKIVGEDDPDVLNMAPASLVLKRTDEISL